MYNYVYQFYVWQQILQYFLPNTWFIHEHYSIIMHLMLSFEKSVFLSRIFCWRCQVSMLKTTVWSWTEWRVCLHCVTAPWNSLRRLWGVSLMPNCCTTSSTPSLQSPQTNQQNQPKVTSNAGSNGNVDKSCFVILGFWTPLKFTSLQAHDLYGKWCQHAQNKILRKFIYCCQDILSHDFQTIFFIK